jgi:hypothetical protein
MLVTLGKPPTGDGWAVEWKFDGRVRLIVIDDGVTVYARNGADFYSLGVLGWGRIRTINVSAPTGCAVIDSPSRQVLHNGAV